MMKLTMFGFREWGGAGAIALILIALFVAIALMRGNAALWYTLVAVTFVIWLAIAAFFRVPAREIPLAPELILSPADGVVKDITVIKDCEIGIFKGMDVVRVGIFLSVFDVHVNRAPCDFKVEYKNYRPGKYLDARDGNCAKENEAMTIGGTAVHDGAVYPVAVRQISGAIARRIVCPPEPGENLSKGAIYGMIKFGSRTELYLPASPRYVIAVKIGDKVYSGISTMAHIK